MKIYTRAGDDGETGLLGGDRVSKTSPRITAIGSVDTLNAALGWAAVATDADSRRLLQRVQSRLFDVGAELACPPGGKFALTSVQPSDEAELEAEIDGWTEKLTELKNFILPGGSERSARLHMARATCRDAERTLLLLHAEEPLRSEILRYINRLSDWLFTLARWENYREGVSDIPWKKSAHD